MPSIPVPRSAMANLAALYALMLAAWLFFFDAFSEPSWIVLVLSAAVAAVFSSFGVTFMAVGRLLGAKHPNWLGRAQAGFLAIVSFLLQAVIALALTLVGAWPHKDLWFLGAIPFIWR